MGLKLWGLIERDITLYQMLQMQLTNLNLTANSFEFMQLKLPLCNPFFYFSYMGPDFNYTQIELVNKRKIKNSITIKFGLFKREICQINFWKQFFPKRFVHRPQYVKIVCLMCGMCLFMLALTSDFSLFLLQIGFGLHVKSWK